MTLNKKRIEHMLERESKKIAQLVERKIELSKHGYWTLGYYQGRVSLLEDMLDDVENNNDEQN